MYWNAVWWIHFHENRDEDNESGKRRCQHLIHNILENLSLLILYQIQILHWNGLTQRAISFGNETRLLLFQIILRYKEILRMVPNHGLQCNIAKESYNFYCSPFKPFSQRQPTHLILIFFAHDSGYMQQLSGKYWKVPLHRVNWVKTQNKWCQSLIHLVYDCSRWKEAIRTPLLTPSKGRI